MELRYTTAGKERRALRAAIHGERASLQVGKAGLDAAVIASGEQVLAARELIKVAIGKSCPLEPDEAAAGLSTALRAEVIEIKGRTVVLYRPEESDD